LDTCYLALSPKDHRGLTLSWCKACGEWILENQQGMGVILTVVYTPHSTTQVWWLGYYQGILPWEGCPSA